jgi:hypothetical protein
MRRVTRMLAGALLGLCAQSGCSGMPAADPVACQQYDSHGICVVQAGSGDSGGQVVTQPVAAGSNAGDASSCTMTASAAVIPCQEGSAWWVQSLQCYAQVMSEQPPRDSPVWGGHTDGAIYSCTFYTGGRAFPGTNGFSFWSATAPAGPAAIDPAVLAQQALRTLTVPAPTTGRYPAGTMQDGQPFTVVARGELVQRHHSLTLGSPVPPRSSWMSSYVSTPARGVAFPLAVGAVDWPERRAGSGLQACRAAG